MMFVGRTNLEKKLLVLANKCHRATVISGINFLSAWFRTALTSNSIVAGGVELAVPEKYLSTSNGSPRYAYCWID